MKERLEFGLRATAKRDWLAVGAKLKFDPYGYAPPSAFADLGKIVEDDVRVILLRRSYFEIFQTWKAFGIRHLANPNAKKFKNGADRTSDDKARISRFHTMHGVPLDMKRVLLCSDGNVIARYLHNKYKSSDTLHYSVGDAIDDMLVLFYNDVCGLSVIEAHDNSDVFSYQDIRSKFFDLAQYLSVPVSAEKCEEVLDNAATRQIEPTGVTLVFPDEALREISDYLETLFHRIRTGELKAQDVIRYSHAGCTVSFHLPGLASIFAKHEETEALLQSATVRSSAMLRRLLTDGRVPRRLRRLFASNVRAQDRDWLSQRPIFVPVAVAPPATTHPKRAPVPAPGQGDLAHASEGE